MNVKSVIKALADTFESSRLKMICLDNTEDKPSLPPTETSPGENELKYQQIAVESKESAFQRQGAHRRFISPLTSDVCVNKIHLIHALLNRPVCLRVCPLTSNCACSVLLLHVNAAYQKFVYSGREL